MPTSDDHNFLVRSPFCVFLDSMEISLSLESKNILWIEFGTHIVSEKLIIALSALITGVLNERYCYMSFLDN